MRIIILNLGILIYSLSLWATNSLSIRFLLIEIPSVSRDYKTYQTNFSRINFQAIAPIESQLTYLVTKKDVSKALRVSSVTLKAGETFPELILPFGPGQYEVWIQSDSLDYSLFFKVVNLDQHELSALVQSEFVNSDDQAIIKLSHDLTKNNVDEKEQVKIFYKWIVENLNYDSSVNPPIKSSIETIQSGKGVCRELSAVFASLLRAKGIPTRVVGGKIKDRNNKWGAHAWNQVWLNEKWVNVDVTNASKLKEFSDIKLEDDLFFDLSDRGIADRFQYHAVSYNY